MKVICFVNSSFIRFNKFVGIPSIPKMFLELREEIIFKTSVSLTLWNVKVGFDLFFKYRLYQRKPLYCVVDTRQGLCLTC